MSVYDLLMLDKPDAIVLWSLVVAGFLVRQFLRKQIEKGEELRNSRLSYPKIM